jgi:uncharacterized phage-associated protein
MANVFDVAKYILSKRGDMTAMKLQKLVYYSQVWTLVWDEEELYPEPIEAWANGAVIRALFNVHRNMFKVSEATFSNGNVSSLTTSQRDNIDKVLDFYGEYTAQQLSDINHQEDPWVNARKGLSPMARSNVEITKGAMLEYHSGIWNAEE